MVAKWYFVQRNITVLDGIGRRIKDRTLVPMLRLVPDWLHPDVITLLSLPAGLLAALAAARIEWAAALAWFAVNRVLDGLDGLVARHRGRQTDFGGYLDILVDFVVYAAIPIGVWWGAPGSGGQPAPPTLTATLALVGLLAAFYVNAASWMYLSAVIEKRTATNRTAADRGSESAESTATSVVMPGGLIEGTETVVFFVLFLLIPRWHEYLFATMAIGTLVGAAQRLLWAFRTLRAPESER